VPLHRNRREFPNPAYLDEEPRSQADPAIGLADWVADLQVSVRRTRQRRRLLVATGSAAALMLTTVGVALATDRPEDDRAQIAGPVTGPAVSRPDAVPEQGHPIQSETPPQRPGGLTLWARGDSDVVAAGRQLGVVIGWRDGAGRLTGLGQDWGDGSRYAVPGSGDCRTGVGSTRLWHTWRTPGTYTVRLSVATASCGAAAERRVVSFTVRVVAPGRAVVTAPDPTGVRPRPKPPTPTTVPVPTPTPAPTSPTPSPTSPSPSPSPTPSDSPSSPVPTVIPTESPSSEVTPTPGPSVSD
jgi:hypothetical protein